jgi:succinyl-diaminopimelate desuccinylase
LCAALEERVRRWQGPAPVVRVLNSLVVPVVRGATSPTGERRYHVALVGHLDTVRTENGPARLEGRRCFGAGASDMKSGLAVMLVLVERLAQEGRLASLPVDLTLVFYSREEGPFAENELGPVLEQVPWLSNVDLAVCLEPSDNKLSLGCNGSLHATVTFQGRTAHSARPWEGDNAIYRAAEFLGRMAKLEPKPTVLDGLTYRTVTTVTQAKDGGRGRNVVPDRFVLNLNHRFAPGTSVEDAEKDVLALVGPHATVEITDRSPPAPPSLAHPLVRGLVASGVRAVEPKQAWTDVGRFHAHGVAAVNFGPGENAQAHQKNESTDLELVDEGYAILRRWLQEPLGNGSG